MMFLTPSMPLPRIQICWSLAIESMIRQARVRDFWHGGRMQLPQNAIFFKEGNPGFNISISVLLIELMISMNWKSV